MNALALDHAAADAQQARRADARPARTARVVPRLVRQQLEPGGSECHKATAQPEFERVGQVLRTVDIATSRLDDLRAHHEPPANHLVNRRQSLALQLRFPLRYQVPC